MSLAPELLLADRYRLVERIAVGGMGEVWRAVDTTLGRQVAVKALKPELADDPDFLARFRAEARHTAALLHPGIANVYDYGEIGDGQGRSGATAAYLVMELVDGEPLSTILSREGRLDPRRALDVCGQAALALHAAHSMGVIHRDVKPGNLLVRPDGVVKVTDFGIARAADAAPTTATGTVLGTAYYLSPEQAGGDRVGPASDVYSLGVVAFECLTGRRPYTAGSAVGVALAHQRDPVPELPDDIPLPVRRVVTQALAKDPADRPAGADVFGRELLAVAEAVYGGSTGEQTVVLPPAVARATGPDATRPLPPLAAAGGAAAGAGGAAAAGSRRAAPPPPPARPSTPPARSAAPLVLGILLALVVAGALLVRALSGGEPAVQPEVPSVVGETLASATTTLQAAGFTVAVDRTETRDAEPDTVLAQTPEAGEQADEGSQVDLEVAAEPEGPETVSVDVDDYSGATFDEVEAALTDLGLRVRRTNTGSGEDPGRVSDVDPSGEVEVDSVVTVFVVPEQASPSPSPSPSPSTPPPSPSPSPPPADPGDEEADPGAGGDGGAASQAAGLPGAGRGNGEGAGRAAGRDRAADAPPRGGRA